MCSLWLVLLQRYAPQLAQDRAELDVSGTEKVWSQWKKKMSPLNRRSASHLVWKEYVCSYNEFITWASFHCGVWVPHTASANSIFCRISRCWGLAVAGTDMAPQCCGGFATFRRAVSTFNLRPPSLSSHLYFRFRLGFSSPTTSFAVPSGFSSSSWGANTSTTSSTSIAAICKW